jgi:hypothetical protein
LDKTSSLRTSSADHDSGQTRTAKAAVRAVSYALDRLEARR